MRTIPLSLRAQLGALVQSVARRTEEEKAEAERRAEASRRDYNQKQARRQARAEGRALPRFQRKSQASQDLRVAILKVLRKQGSLSTLEITNAMGKARCVVWRGLVNLETDGEIVKTGLRTRPKWEAV